MIMAAIDTYDAVVLLRGEAGRRSDSVEFQPILNGNSSNEAAP
jgi:hypothetical protein